MKTSIKKINKETPKEYMILVDDKFFAVAFNKKDAKLLCKALKAYDRK